MAGLFYSLQEAAERLKKTEQEVKELVKQGKLREFRDGSHLLFKVDEVEALAVEENVPIAIEGLEAEQAPEQEKPIKPMAKQPKETKEPVSAAEAKEKPEPEFATEGEILLAPETGVPAAESGLAEADTALAGEGVSVLGETDKDYHGTEDTMAETVATTAAPGTSSEASLQEIEEDVNLDTFGSGSGLLDLSLQADDTSLGGVLDEIYTAESEGQVPAEAGTAAELTAEAEKMIAEEGLPAQPAPEVAAIAPSYIEPEPDIQSNTLGMLLFLPLALLIYTAAVAIAGLQGVVPSVLSAIQGAIWYIVVGAMVVAGLVVGAAFYLSGDLSYALKKPQIAKKPKKAKKAKEASPSAA